MFIHAYPVKSPETENLPSLCGRQAKKEAATPAWQLSEFITKGSLLMRHIMDNGKMKWVPTPLGRCQGIILYMVKGGWRVGIGTGTSM